MISFFSHWHFTLYVILIISICIFKKLDIFQQLSGNIEVLIYLKMMYTNMGIKTIIGKLSIYHRPASYEELERKEIKHKSCVYCFLMTNVNWNITILNFLQFHRDRHFIQLFGIDIFFIFETCARPFRWITFLHLTSDVLRMQTWNYPHTTRINKMTALTA